MITTRITPAHRPVLNTAKLSELVLHASQQHRDSSSWSLTKLHKVLFFSDFEHMLRADTPITGSTYVHRRHGPAAQELH